MNKLRTLTFLLIIFSFTMIGFGAQAGEDNASQPFHGKVRLALPKVIYGVVGIEMNVYFSNIVLVINPDNYAFEVICDKKGIQQAERWTFIPKPSDVGEFPIKIQVRDQDNTIIARGKSTVKIVASDAGAGREISILCIGDSLTHQSVYIQQILDLCNDSNNPQLKLIGSHHIDNFPADNLHEGYGGRTTEWFATNYNPTTARNASYPYLQRGSPFLYPDSEGIPKLDFARYCKDVNAPNSPELVTIFLGINDIFSATDADIDARIDNSFKYYDELITMVHSVNKYTKIGVALPPPPAASQDAFGANAGCFSRWRYNRNQHRYVERMIEHFAGREDDNISIIPVHVNLDCHHNYPVNNMPWNSQTTRQGVRQVNAVHPAPEGYRQIGDSFYFWIKAVTFPSKTDPFKM